jgi:hypothetical protein
MTTGKPQIQALGKKLKRRTLNRTDWQFVHHVLRAMRGGHTQRGRDALRPFTQFPYRHLVTILDRHAPTLYDLDPLALRASFMDRFAPGGRLDAARHMIRKANGRQGIDGVFAHVGSAFSVRGVFEFMQVAKLPVDRSAS